MNIGIIGIGSFLPDNRVTNIDLEKRMDTSDEWIRTRTGIEARHLAEGDVTVADMATRAAERALQSAGVAIDEIEAIMCDGYSTSLPGNCMCGPGQSWRESRCRLRCERGM